MSKSKFYFHFTADTLRDGRPVPPVGEWLVHSGKVKMCDSGLHASADPWDALQYAPGAMLHVVQLRQVVERGDDKVVAKQRRIIASLDATELCRKHARESALAVVGCWTAPTVVKEWLQTGDEAKRAESLIPTTTGAVAIASLKGDGLANALMKAETKAKRRLTLSMCGLGMLDETELETIPSKALPMVACAKCGNDTTPDNPLCADCRPKAIAQASEPELESQAIPDIPELPEGFTDGLDNDQCWAKLVDAKAFETKKSEHHPLGTPYRLLKFQAGQKQEMSTCFDARLFGALDALVGQWIVFRYESRISKKGGKEKPIAELTGILWPHVETWEAAKKEMRQAIAAADLGFDGPSIP